MATEFTVKLKHQPGTLAELGAALGDANINIDAIQAMPFEGQGIIQFVPHDPAGAAAALAASDILYTTRQVLIVNLLDQPGTLGEVALVMAHANINIDAVYVTLSGKAVLGVDDLAGARQVADGMAVM